MGKAISLVIIGALVSLAGACSSTVANQIASAGRVGCYPKEIQVEEIDSGWGGVVWAATCRGKKFICTGTGEDVDCTELLAGPAPTGTAVAPAPPAPLPPTSPAAPMVTTPATAAQPPPPSPPAPRADDTLERRPDGTCWAPDPNACAPNTPCDPPLIQVSCP